MKALLTASGLTTDALMAALTSLLDPSEKRRVAFVPTAAWPVDDDKAWQAENLSQIRRVADQLDVVEPSVLPNAEWRRRLEAASVIVVGGGDAGFLLSRFHSAGILDAFRDLVRDRVYVGISAGSIVAGPDIAWLYRLYGRPIADGPIDGLGLAELAVLPHAGREPEEMLAAFVDVASSLPYPAFLLDDDSGLLVSDSSITIVGDGGQRVN